MDTPSNDSKIRWGLIASGYIAGQFARGVANSRTGTVTAIGSRSQAGADRFAEQFPTIEHRHGSYQEVLDNPDVDAVYISTPHPWHKEWAIKAAQAGKHILCEKPIGMNAAEAEEIIAAARDANVFLMEAYMYRCSHQTRKLVELIRSGEIGEVKSFEAHFSFDAGWNPDSRLLAPELGGGGILDVGGYPMTLAQLVAGVGAGGDFAEAEEVVAFGHLGETGVDEYTSALARFPSGMVARLSVGVRLEEELTASVYGTKGRILIEEPWKPCVEGGETTLKLFRNTDEPTVSQLEEIRVPSDQWLYGLEADAAGDAIKAGATEPSSPVMNGEETLANMRSLDRWRSAIGLRYPVDG